MLRRPSGPSGQRRGSEAVTTPSPPPAGESGLSAENPGVCALSGGGSETTSRPPERRKGAPHSVVTAGGPKDLATTASKRPRRPPSRPAVSARRVRTRTRSSRPSWHRASIRKEDRRPLTSKRVPSELPQRVASTSPGSPPPEPRSKKAPGAPGERVPSEGPLLSTAVRKRVTHSPNPIE